MTVTELRSDQLLELKQAYLCALADEGRYAEVTGAEYDAPSYGDLENADAIVPDDVIFEAYEGVEFVEEDF